MPAEHQGQSAPAPAPADPPEFDLTCDWRPQAGHPHLAVGYVVEGGETVWGVYVCSATTVTSGNEWSFTLPMSFNLVEVTNIAINVVAWDRFVVVESERPFFTGTVKHQVIEALRTIIQSSRPCRLITAIRDFFGES